MGVSRSQIAATKRMPEPIVLDGSRFAVEKVASWDEEFEITSLTRLADGRDLRLKMRITGDEALEEVGPSDDGLASAALRLGAIRLQRRIQFEVNQAEGRDTFEENYGDPLIDAAKAKQAEEAAQKNQAALEELPMFGMF